MRDKNILIKFKKLESLLKGRNFSFLITHYSFLAGQALVTLIFFTVIATTVTTAAIFVITENLLSGSRFQEGTIARQIAESGADEALIRILRDPSYAGETIAVGSGSATIQVTGTGTDADPFVIQSAGEKRTFTRSVEVRAVYNADNELEVTSHKEVF